MKNKPINILIPLVLAVVMFLSPLAIQAASPNGNDKFQAGLDELKDLAAETPPAGLTNANALSNWSRDKKQKIIEKVKSLYKAYPKDPRRWEAVWMLCNLRSSFSSPPPPSGAGGINYDMVRTLNGNQEALQSMVADQRIDGFLASQESRYWHDEVLELTKKLKTAPDVPEQIRIEFDVWELGAVINSLRAAQQLSGQLSSMRIRIYQGVTNDYKDKKSVASGLKNFLARWPDHDASQLFEQYVKMATFQKNADAQIAVLKEFQDTPNISVNSYIKTRLAEMDRLANFGNITFTAVDGREMNLEKLRGKVVLFHVWGTGSRSAISMHSGLLKLYKTYHGKGLEIIGVSTDGAGNKDKVLAFIKDQKIPWPVSFEGKGRSQNPMTTALGLNNGYADAPWMVLIDKKGKASAVSRDLPLEPEIKRLLSQK